MLALGDQITFIGACDDVHAIADLFESYVEPDQQPTHSAA
jgi:hypothetical protein